MSPVDAALEGPTPSPSAEAALPTTRPATQIILEAGRGERNYWADLWRYRELFLILAWRDLAVRYKQTVIGVLWAILRPLLTMLVLTIVFGRVAKLPSVGSAPYPIMVFAGMLPWFLFSTILSEASNSLVTNATLIGKVYFPRIIVPTSAAVVALADFAVSFVILVGLMVFYGYAPSWRIVLLPAFILLAALASLGPALMLSALNVRFRDFRYIVPFIVQFGVYISPVGFSSAIVPSAWRLWYSLNPLVGVIDGFRWCILAKGAVIYPPSFAISLALVSALLWLGVRYFRATERTFADVI